MSARKAAWLAAIAIGVLATTSCTTPAPPPSGAPTVLLFGDSITALSASAFEESLPGYSVSQDAEWGTTIDQRMTAAQIAGTTFHDVVVINIGTNDAWDAEDKPATDPAVAAWRLQQLASYFHSSCVVFVHLNTHAVPGDGTWNEATAQAINDAESSLTDRIVRWEDVADQPGNTATDGLHPSQPQGVTALADLAKPVITSCPVSFGGGLTGFRSG